MSTSRAPSGSARAVLKSSPGWLAAVALLLWLPIVRRPLHALGDLSGRLYERVADRLLRRPRASPA